MKNIVYGLLFVFIVGFDPRLILAATPTPDTNTNKINELKEKVASKVAELRQKKNIILSGEVKSVKGDTIVLITDSGDKEVSVNKSTKYFWVKTTGVLMKINYSNVASGDEFSILSEGYDNDVLTAITAIGKVNTFPVEGEIKSIDAVNKTFKITLKDKDTVLIISAPSTTAISSMTTGNTFSTGKFGNLSVGSRVLIRGNYKNSKKQEIQAKRIIIFNTAEPQTINTTP